MGSRKERTERLEGVSLEKRLEAYRRGVLKDDMAIASLVADLGSEGRIDAEWEIAKLLDHDCQIVRYNSLGALGFDLGSALRVSRMIEILRKDPDVDCRRKAAAVLGSLFEGDKELKVLRVLETVLCDSNEENSVKVFAYWAILSILGIPRSERPNTYRMRQVSEKEVRKALELIKATVGCAYDS